ncbi:hypothetical protein EDB86DRAFT_3081110 [Lactarius hatsudake]|nr:hypothetical protein EDB86DRAFT_3081110 [Lactarius hatsudake]
MSALSALTLQAFDTELLAVTPGASTRLTLPYAFFTTFSRHARVHRTDLALPHFVCTPCATTSHPPPCIARRQPRPYDRACSLPPATPHDAAQREHTVWQNTGAELEGFTTYKQKQTRGMCCGHDFHWDRHYAYFLQVDRGLGQGSGNGAIITSSVLGKVNVNCKLGAAFLVFMPMEYYHFDPSASKPSAALALTAAQLPPRSSKCKFRSHWAPRFRSPIAVVRAFELSFTPRAGTLEDVAVELYLGSSATGAACTGARSGAASGWPGRTATLRGLFASGDAHPRPASATLISFAPPAGALLSALKTDQLELSGETYKPYKGGRVERGTNERYLDAMRRDGMRDMEAGIEKSLSRAGAW